MKSFQWQNVIDGGGIDITVTGMLIVFLGLLFISFFIASLPHALKLVDNLTAKRKPAVFQSQNERKSSNPDEQEAIITSVIATVIHAELEKSGFGDQSKITISRDVSHFWASTGKMRKLPNRSSHA